MDQTTTRLPASSSAIKDEQQGWSGSGSARIPSFETMDRLGRAATARLTQGILPHALYAAWFDWASHLTIGVEADSCRFVRRPASMFVGGSPR